ncbi:transposase [filamentous cyanobacterium CCP5]|nr:transposase [filamentous cyanobacterium CCP5]
MAPRKLSDADKQEILKLYREPKHTTSTLAEQYGVSNSTISRLLKSQLPEDEYGALIQQKRTSNDKAPEADAAKPSASKSRSRKASGTKAAAAKGAKRSPSKSRSRQQPSTEPAAPVTVQAESAAEAVPASAGATPVPESAPDPGVEPATVESASSPTKEKPKLKPKTPLAEPADPEPEEPDSEGAPRLRRRRGSQDSDQAQQLSLPDHPPESAGVDDDDLDNEDDDEVAANLTNDDFDGDDDYGDDDDFDGEDDDSDDDWQPTAAAEGAVSISPLTDAALPRLCYLVVDRSSADLVTCALKDFSDLGQIPEDEQNSRTLPIFDNHRVARRFSRRNQRVIKVPDGGLLRTTRAYLHAKGITRLLIDGQVYTIEAEETPATV